MGAQLTCTNCERTMRASWLVCHYCNQARWKRVAAYSLWGAIFTIISRWTVRSNTQFTFSDPGETLSTFLPVAGAILGIIGIVMLVMALAAALRGLRVKKVKPTTRSTAQNASAPAEPKDISEIKMVIPLSGGVLSGVDETILRFIDDHIRNANAEKDWDTQSLVPGQENRKIIPYNTRSILDHLLTDHKLTSDTTLEHLFKFGNDSLRERIIRSIAAIGTQEMVPVLEKFASRDPLRKTYYRDSGSNITYADESDCEYPLRELANEAINKIKSGL